MSPKSNAGIFLLSLLNCGYPGERMDADDVSSSLNGLECHIQRVPEPDRPGLKREARADGRTFDRTIVTVTKIHKFPWDKGKAAKKEKAAKVAAETSQDLVKAVESKVVELLADNPEGIIKKKLTTPIFDAFEGDERNEAVQLVFSDEFLGDDSRPWVYEDGVVKLA